MRQPLDFIDPGAGDSEIVKVAGGHLRAWGAEIEHLRAVLKPFAEAATKAEISGRPCFEFVGADDYAAAKSAHEQ